MNRNDPCTCGSGKKYKKCCGAADPYAAGTADASEHSVAFSCVGTCADQCCGGATMITIDEVALLFDTFPLTVGFRQYVPVDDQHALFLEAAGMRIGNHHIVGDFIAGNWRRRRCRMLEPGNRCQLHREGRKPLQCSLVPFGALYPEDSQHRVIAAQRQRAFRQCRGFAPDLTPPVVWSDGRFADAAYGEAFTRYRSGLLRQQPLMAAILKGLQRSPDFGAFLRGEGIFETAVPPHLFGRFFDLAGLAGPRRDEFIERQQDLCAEERGITPDAAVFDDVVSVLAMPDRAVS